MKDKGCKTGEALYRGGEESLYGGGVNDGIDLLTNARELDKPAAADLLSRFTLRMSLA